MKCEANRRVKQFMPHSETPAFATVYRKNYGLEDRFNAILYAYFAQNRCKTAACKYTWLYFYICLWNAYALYTEKSTPAIRAHGNSVDTLDIGGFSRFLLAIVHQIGEEFAQTPSLN